jgi:hypothetical protein
VTTGYHSTRPYRDGFNLGDEAFFGGPWDPNVWAADLRAGGTTMRDDLLFLTPGSFQGAREVRLQAKLSF